MSHRCAVATWTELNHTQAPAAAERERGVGGEGGGEELDNNQNNKQK